MIRKFIQCKNTNERLNLMVASKEQEWAEGELDTVMEIFGLKIPEGASKNEKWELIMQFLTSKKAADDVALENKLFQDVEETKAYETEGTENLSDLNAYLKVCKENEVVR